MTTNEKNLIIKNFKQHLIDVMNDLDPKYARCMNDNFWDLVCNDGDNKEYVEQSREFLTK